MCTGTFNGLLSESQAKKKLRNTTGRNMTWGVFKAYVFFFFTQYNYAKRVHGSWLNTKGCETIYIGKVPNTYRSRAFQMF